jgi:AcrR family transcriptional regulator
MTSTGTTTASRKVKSSIKDVPLIEERREQLVSAAVRVFKQKGFHAATIRDIGRAAGMTQGTIYNYVRSKDDILYLVCDRLVSQYQDETQRALEATQNSAQRIALITRAVAEVTYEHQDEILLIYQNTHLEIPGGHPDPHQRLRRDPRGPHRGVRGAGAPEDVQPALRCALPHVPANSDCTPPRGRRSQHRARRDRLGNQRVPDAGAGNRQHVTQRLHRAALAAGNPIARAGDLLGRNNEGRCEPRRTSRVIAKARR